MHRSAVTQGDRVYPRELVGSCFSENAFWIAMGFLYRVSPPKKRLGLIFNSYSNNRQGIKIHTLKGSMHMYFVKENMF